MERNCYGLSGYVQSYFLCMQISNDMHTVNVSKIFHRFVPKDWKCYGSTSGIIYRHSYIVLAILLNIFAGIYDFHMFELPFPMHSAVELCF